MCGPGSCFDRAMATLALDSGSREATADLMLGDPADDHAASPCVVICRADQEGEPDSPPVYLRPPSPPALAAFIFASPRHLSESDLAAWLPAGDRELLVALSGAMEQLARLVLAHGRRPLGRQREQFAIQRATVEDGLRQGLALRLEHHAIEHATAVRVDRQKPPPPRLTFGEERTFAYLAGLVAASVFEPKSVAPRGYRVCEVCVRVFARQRASKCPTCKAWQRAERRTPDDPSERLILVASRVFPLRAERDLPVGEVSPATKPAEVLTRPAPSEPRSNLHSG